MFLFPIISQASWEFDNTTQKKRVDEGYIEKNLKSAGYWNLEFKIHIDNNWSETEATYDWCSGSGTWSNPYIIEDLVIDGEGSGSSILIENSNNYFIIRNSTVYNSGSVGTDAGVNLQSVSNGMLISNNISNNNRYGMYLWNSDNNMVSGNTATNNNRYGMYLYYSDNNTVSGNNVINSKIYGIYIRDSDNNTIMGNTVIDNKVDKFGKGIYLDGSDNNTVSKNSANNYEYGIYLYD
ncbi:hypothetical protein LCGC14_1671340, partial [marine sediment metagenome]